MSLEVKIDTRAVDQWLGQLKARSGNKALTGAAREAAKFLKPRVKAAAPRGKTGNLRKGVYRGTAKRDKPGAFVAIRHKTAPHRHLVIRGTKTHSTRKVRPGKSEVQAFAKGGRTFFSRGHRHPGSKANPFVSRTADQYGGQALAAAERSLIEDLDL